MFHYGYFVVLMAVCFSCMVDEGRAAGRQKRVVGGLEAKKGQFPFLVSMWRRNTKGTFDHRCGGALINESWVISAAHCYTAAYNPQNQNASNWRAYLGVHNRDQANTVAQIRRIVEIHIEPMFDIDKFSGDVALLKLDKPAQLNSNVKIIKINDDPNYPQVNETVTAMGWGITEFNGTASYKGPKSNVPRTLDTKITTEQSCKDTFRPTQELKKLFGNKNTNLLIDSKTLCVGWSAGKAVCSGDSGGPLIGDHCSTGERVLVGVVSYGYYCYGTNPSVFARVSSFHQWIKSTIGIP